LNYAVLSIWVSFIAYTENYGDFAFLKYWNTHKTFNQNVPRRKPFLIRGLRKVIVDDWTFKSNTINPVSSRLNRVMGTVISHAVNILDFWSSENKMEKTNRALRKINSVIYEVIVEFFL
jgi:hypothetical protein